MINMEERAIMLQLLQWRFIDVLKNLPVVYDQGFNIVQIGPCQMTKDQLYEWWKLYQPCNLRPGNLLGGEEEIYLLCNGAHKRGMKVIMDVVFTHVAGGNDSWNSEQPNANVEEWLKQYCINDLPRIKNYDDRFQVCNLGTGTPRLNYRLQPVQEAIKGFLNRLKELGVDGFRIDECKHIALPSEGCDFFTNLKDTFKGTTTYGECIHEEREHILKEYIDNGIGCLCERGMGDLDKFIVRHTETHDTFYEGHDVHISDNSYIDNYNWLLSGGRYDTLMFARPMNTPLEGLWMDKRIKDINWNNR